MEVTDTNNKRCNVLHQGDDFCVTVTYHADELINKLELACSLTDKSGQVITGQRFPAIGSHLPGIQKGTSFGCTFKFQGCLQPGLYFLNAGAWNCPEKLYLHRIVDGSVLRVLPSRTTSYGFGMVNLTCSTPKLS